MLCEITIAFMGSYAVLVCHVMARRVPAYKEQCVEPEKTHEFLQILSALLNQQLLEYQPTIWLNWMQFKVCTERVFLSVQLMHKLDTQQVLLQVFRLQKQHLNCRSKNSACPQVGHTVHLMNMPQNRFIQMITEGL